MNTIKLACLFFLVFVTIGNAQLKFSGKNTGDVRQSLGGRYEKYASFDLRDGEESVFQVIFTCYGSGIQRTNLLIARTTGEHWRLKTYKSFYGWIGSYEIVKNNDRAQLRVHLSGVGQEGFIDIDLDFSGELTTSYRKSGGDDAAKAINEAEKAPENNQKAEQFVPPKSDRAGG